MNTYSLRTLAAVLLSVSLLCSSTLRAAIYSGTCGAPGNEDNVTWTFDTENGTLTILGTGAMKDWTSAYSNRPPWYSYKDAIKAAVLSDDLTNIGAYMFLYCIKITSIEFPNNLNAIGTRAFEGCTGLTSITIPDSVSTMGDCVFLSCSGLTDIYVGWTENIPIWPTSFTNKSPQSNITLHVPCNCKSLYETADGWNGYTIEELSCSPTTIGNTLSSPKEDMHKVNKRLHNGRLYIIHGNKTYNTMGIEVKYNLF